MKTIDDSQEYLSFLPSSFCLFLSRGNNGEANVSSPEKKRAVSPKEACQKSFSPKVNSQGSGR